MWAPSLILLRPLWLGADSSGDHYGPEVQVLWHNQVWRGRPWPMRRRGKGSWPATVHLN